MKTLLVAIDSKFIHSSLAVYSLYETALEYEKKYGGDIGQLSLKEYTINDIYENVLLDIMDQKADSIAFAVYIWNIDFARKLIGDIRAIDPNCLIILGGPEVSHGTDLLYDYIIIGEGERAFYGLLCYLNNYNLSVKDFNFTIDKDKVYADLIPDLKEIPFPYNKNNIKNFENRIIYYESSRGCPYSCAYCLSSVEKGLRFLDLDRVYKDLDFFIENRVKQVKFVDRTFNCNPKRAYRIFEYIIEHARDCETNFHFEVGADLFDEETLKLLASAPLALIQFEAGIQSTYEKALIESVRKTDLDKVFYNIKKIISMDNINMHVDLIAGLPYETLDIFKKSFNDAYSLKAHQLQLGFLKILRGTPLNDLADKHGYVFSNNSPYTILKNNYLSNEDIRRLMKIEDVFNKVYNSGKFILSMDRLLSYYKSPFDMYEDLALYFEERGYSLASMASRLVYDLVFEFIHRKFPEKKEDFAKILLIDFFGADRSDAPPESLQFYWKSARSQKDRIRDILSEKGLAKEYQNFVRFIGDEAYVFDYSDKNKVTGRYVNPSIKNNREA